MNFYILSFTSLFLQKSIIFLNSDHLQPFSFLVNQIVLNNLYSVQQINVHTFESTYFILEANLFVVVHLRDISLNQASTLFNLVAI